MNLIPHTALPSIRSKRHCSPVQISVLCFFALCGLLRAQDTTSASLNPPTATEAAIASLPDAPQPQVANPAPVVEDDAVTLRSTPANILKDQAAIWTSPARIRENNALLPVALVLGTALTITVDHQIMSSSRLVDPSLNSHADTASNGLLGAFVAAPAIIFGLGHIRHDDQATETGILAGEAMVDTVAVVEGMKLISLRERPTVDNARGRFFQTSAGANSAFPSMHSAIAWSSATAIATEYNGPLTKITVFGLATGVSVTRILARQHFPSDVLVGSAVGWMIGRYVVHRHRRA